jgi:predicted ribosome quality control (RQC) complex YloA/Tae2 family protein
VASKGRPFRTTTVEGFDVLIGKGDRENDHLTFEVAEPDDVWLHVAGGTAGSHVVIRNPERLQALPKSVIEAAAALAAWHSKARNALRVDVHVCRARDVGKERGAPAGQVVLRRWTRVRVQPSPGTDEEERKQAGRGS